MASSWAPTLSFAAWNSEAEDVAGVGEAGGGGLDVGDDGGDAVLDLLGDLLGGVEAGRLAGRVFVGVLSERAGERLAGDGVDHELRRVRVVLRLPRVRQFVDQRAG